MHNALVFLLILLLSGALLTLATAWLMAWSILHPPRMTDAKANAILRRLSPQDLGLPYQNERYTLRDDRTGQNLDLAAWWIPARSPADRTILLIHGYADAKVGAIAWAPLLHDLGCNILAIDLRAHGESGGKYTTAGFYERHDLSQIINRLRLERPAQTRQLILFGISMGGAVAAATAVLHDDLDGIILESPYATFRTAVMAHFDLIGAPGRFVQRLALKFAESMTAARFDEIHPIELIPRLPFPLLLIQSGDDPFISPADDAALRQAIAARAPLPLPTDHFHAEGVPHLRALIDHPDEYRAYLVAFLEKVTSRAYKNPQP